VEAVMEGRITTASLVDFVLANAGRAPLVYSSQSPDQIRSSQDIYGRDAIARELDQLFAATARGLVRNGVRRLVVAGGETSGAVVSALDVEALAIGPEIDPGVPVLTAEGGEPLALALKSGNFGSMDFFTKALARLSGK
jgi:3-dehydrotetronate 4-kinase